MRCYACHQPVGANARFCSICGAALAFANPAPPVPIQQPSAAETAYANPVTIPYAAAPEQPGQFSYAPVPGQPGQPRHPAQRMGAAPFTPARADEFYAPAPLSYDASANVPLGSIPLGYTAPAALPAPYAPAPGPTPAPAAPSMVNNVMVTQVTPPTPAPAVVVDARGGGAGVVLRALFFLLTGIALGALWVGAAFSGGSAAAWAFLFVAAATVGVLLLDVAILNRYPHR